MKNLKKIARQSLKTITGGRPAAASECIACGCQQPSVIILMETAVVVAVEIFYVHNYFYKQSLPFHGKLCFLLQLNVCSF